MNTKWLQEICKEHVRKFLFSANEVTTLVAQTTELQRAQSGDSRSGCRADGCNAAYAYHSAGVRKSSLFVIYWDFSLIYYILFSMVTKGTCFFFTASQ